MIKKREQVDCRRTEEKRGRGDYGTLERGQAKVSLTKTSVVRGHPQATRDHGKGKGTTAHLFGGARGKRNRCVSPVSDLGRADGRSRNWIKTRSYGRRVEMDFEEEVIGATRSDSGKGKEMVAPASFTSLYRNIQLRTKKSARVERKVDPLKVEGREEKPDKEGRCELEEETQFYHWKHAESL